MLPAFHFLHIFVAASWAGFTLFVGLFLLPGLARMPANDAQPFINAMLKRIGSALGMLGGLTYLFGIARGLTGGGISSIGDLWSIYALMILTAILLVGAIEGIGGRTRREFRELVHNPEHWKSEALGLARRAGFIQVALLALVVALMVIMGLSMY